MIQVKNVKVHELLGRLRSYLQESDLSRKYKNEEPLRAELFNTDQLEQHGRYLAQTHKIRIGKGPDRLLKRLAENEKILFEARNLLAESVKEDTLITPAGEWLLDNFYLIEDHIRTGKRHLPKGYSETLPGLTNGVSAGLPRVYDIALDLISHSDGRIDAESLNSFIRSYQEVTKLKLGELWAIPIMLRLALIENLRRVAARIAIDRVNRNIANYWATQMKETSEKDPKSLILVIADMARSVPPMESSFVAEMIRQLMWQGPALALPLTWMEQRLSESGLTTSELVTIENQKQAADQVSISNSIGSLRFLGSMEWREFVEEMSVVEQTLRKDISGIYPAMDFATRDRYRHVVERISRYSKFSELEVASIAVQLSVQFAGKGFDKRISHVGYFLVGEGLEETERRTGQRLPVLQELKRTVKKFPVTFYAGSITLVTLCLSWYLLLHGHGSVSNIWLLSVAALLAVLVSSHFAMALVNWVTTGLFKPELLPRMDFSEGISSEHKTLVIVPTMLANEVQIDRMVEALEIRFLANRSENLYFGLLTDFTDAASETLPGDDALLTLASKKITALNEQYRRKEDMFFLFHRPRKWNPYDKIWMGYERKRGKLKELNLLLRKNAKEYFSAMIGDLSVLRDVKYIITLDSDTQLPRDAGWKLVGTMAHPLNKPYYDAAKALVTKGYGILQPRVSVSMLRERSTTYAQINGNDPGIDPYTRLTSDVYQDLFHEGSFIGKGIYEIDAFEQALDDRFPENRILSHDLLEGCYTRAGLVTDVEFYEEYPTHYSADVNRRHRWIRGDWQIAWWALPVVPDKDRKLRQNPLSALSRWKIFDNLRRSLVPFALTALLICGWTLFNEAIFWTSAIILVMLLPSLLASVWHIFRKPKEIDLWQHITLSIRSVADSFLQNAFMFACLPYEAYYTVDAISRTTWRMIVSHKKLLEWNPSGNQEHTSDKTIASAYRSMWFGPVIAAITFVYLTISAPFAMFAALPVLILWALSPFTAWWVSKPVSKGEAKLSASQIIFLRKLARKTWSFFEQFVVAEDNWLPPDNYQESHNRIVAHRTSPTNIGLALLANLSAYDFGYITGGTLIKRTADTLSTLELLERYHGHLFNWYDTVTLKPLYPRYVSTVDSGNLAGHLLVLRQGLLSLKNEAISASRLFEGIKDTLYLMSEDGEVPAPLIEDINSVLAKQTITPGKAKIYAAQLLKYMEGIEVKIPAGQSIESRKRLLDAMQQCRHISEEMSRIFPWLLIPAAPEKYAEWRDRLEHCTLVELAAMPATTSVASGDTAYEKEWLEEMRLAITEASSRAAARIATIDRLAAMCSDFADLEYDFLYDKSKNLLAIGYNVDEHRRDTGFYDLLASEVSLCIFVAIAQGKLPQESWFALGRSLTNTKTGKPVLLSWSGSMFEYLMPQLVMPVYDNTLLSQTYKSAVARQVEYGAERNVPWGISESGYNMVDANLNYQYHAFGVPGLGLKRGLSEDLVIAPYASMLALMVSPEAACNNLERLSTAGFEGEYGFYEAIDYTPSRLPRGQSFAVIQSFMAHHQGMGLLSLAYFLLEQPMQKRFEAELQFQATMLLLQERLPKAVSFYAHTADIATTFTPASGDAKIRVINTPHTPAPEVQLLSNGRYHVMVTNTGGGYSRWKDIAVTRWREDPTCDNWGSFCYIRDTEDGSYWSNTYQPARKQPDSYEATFTQGRAEFRRSDNRIETYTEIVVSPEDDIEMRRVHLTNKSRKRRTIEVTSYTEVVINQQAADAMHPAFSNLFVQTEISEQRHAVLCTRRPRSQEERPPWMFHLMTIHGLGEKEVSYETDRAKFIGRNHSIADPAALNTPGPLSNTQGPVLDPIAAIRYLLTIEPEETVLIDMIIGISDTREGCQGLVEKYQDKHHKDRVFELAWTHSQVVLRQINATESDAQLYAQLGGSVIYSNPLLRADPSIVMKNRRGQSGLWGYSISGDLPIVLLQIENEANIELAKQLVQAHAYWRLKGLAVDLVIWNEDHGGYRQVLQNQILGLVAAGVGAELSDHPGGVFVRAADQISDEDRILFQTVARVSISDTRGKLEDQLNRKSSKNVLPFFSPIQSVSRRQTSVAIPEDLLFFNGSGGFSPDGKEYVIILKPGDTTPAPWVNILANPDFGSVVSESGQAYTWVENAHEMRLTPWENDALCDKGGEIFYLRDEESGHFWSPTPLPTRGSSPYVIRHGFGYSTFEHSEDGIDSEMCMFVDVAEPVKFFVLKLKNNSGRQRRLSVTGYIEWVLGDMRPKTATHVITEPDPNSNALFARNAYHPDFAQWVAFFDTDENNRTFTGDRGEFIGRNGTLENPDGMLRSRLSGKTGAVMDPCAAIQSVFVLSEGQERRIVFRLGAGMGMDATARIVQKFKGITASLSALDRVKKHWADVTSAVQVKTPDPAVDMLANGWLIYQAIGCRLWARSGYYQSGGAFGFRDQLQDVLAVMHTTPSLARKQILLCASRQFREGDVQHWWHPPAGRGVRTRCSDDLLWLPYVTAGYVLRTGDATILDEPVFFLEGRPLNPGEMSYYDLPMQSRENASLYQHCIKAIEQGLKFGTHGLPLIGAGDWNDGMDMVGDKGRGESIWLAFFLYDVLVRFSKIAVLRSDGVFAGTCINESHKLQVNIERHGWDGNWYRRAYFDDGTPLGSASNDECQIDSISQSWAVLSGAGDIKRSYGALNEADKRMVSEKDRLIKLLTPAFDKSSLNPGYIKGYVPGIRENGGQYTHAAIWLIMAHAKTGNAKRAWELMNMINPIGHADSAAKVAVYKTEPYVAAADVYSLSPNNGRGGWTWYTGSAGWMYQLIIEWLLGIQLEGNTLMVKPCIPNEWKSFSINYRYKTSNYKIVLLRGDINVEGTMVTVDGHNQKDDRIFLTDDGGEHIVEILLPVEQINTGLQAAL